DVPDTLAVERLAEQGETTADLVACRLALGVGLRPAGRPDAARRDRGEGPLVELQRLAILLELRLVQLRLDVQLERLLESRAKVAGPLLPAGLVHGGQDYQRRLLHL